MRRKELTGKTVLLSHFLDIVNNSKQYIALKTEKGFSIHRAQKRISRKKEPIGSAIFSIKGGFNNPPQLALCNRGARKKIATYMPDLVPQLIGK